MHWTERRRRFRAILEGKRCLHPASVFDPISARIAEDLGYELGMLAGSVASLAVLGAPDIILLTLSEFAAQAYRIGRAGNLPLLVDADHGYGNALNVMRTVDELETAGVAALTIEDTELPAAFGADKARLVAIEEGVGKMRAAITARQDPDLAIVGRTAAASLTGIDDAVARAKAYAAVGVDAVFLVGVRKRAELDAVASAVRTPIILGGAGAELDDAEYLAGRGVRVALQGHLPIMAAVQAVRETMKALRAGAKPASLPGIAASDLMQQVTRDRAYKSWADAFLKPAGGRE